MIHKLVSCNDCMCYHYRVGNFAGIISIRCWRIILTGRALRDHKPLLRAKHHGGIFLRRRIYSTPAVAAGVTDINFTGWRQFFTGGNISAPFFEMYSKVIKDDIIRLSISVLQ